MASRMPWERVSLLEIADEAGISESDLKNIYPAKSDILAAIVHAIDEEIENNIGEQGANMSSRDRLFDVLMERFDILNRHRESHKSFLKSFGWTREASCADKKLFRESMIQIAQCAGIDTDGLFGMGRVAGVTIIYLWVLGAWMNDATPDLSRTMAELDKTLSRAEWVKEKFTEYMGRGQG